MSTKEPEPKPQLCYSRVTPGSYQIKLLCPRCSVQVSKNELSCLGLQFFDKKYVRKMLVFLELDKFYSPKPGYSSRGFITCLNKAKLFCFLLRARGFRLPFLRVETKLMVINWGMVPDFTGGIDFRAWETLPLAVNGYVLLRPWSTRI